LKAFFLAEKEILFTIEKNNGIIKKSDILEKFNLIDKREANAINFFIVCFKSVFEIEEKKIFKKILVSSKEILTDIKKIIQETEKIITEENKLFADHEIYTKLATIFPNVSKEQFFNFLDASHSVRKNKFGKWGMTDWTEVSPKGTREKVYLVLKEHKNPLHFTQIAKMIDKLEFGKRKAHPQTVHNELIKDNRFVLVGRGIYALSEWGYSRGTIKEVIENILQKNGKPMEKEEIISEVLKSRKVKKTTIMINLNNKNFYVVYSLTTKSKERR
jgi:DNA-directed RNA polymerase delta subunit